MAKEINIENAQLTILLESEGKVYLLGMGKEKLEAVNFMVKNAAEIVVATDKTQSELNSFLMGGNRIE